MSNCATKGENRRCVEQRFLVPFLLLEFRFRQEASGMSFPRIPIPSHKGSGHHPLRKPLQRENWCAKSFASVKESIIRYPWISKINELEH